MAFYRNQAAGARMIRCAGRSFVTVEPGATVSIARHLVGTLPDSVVEVDEDGEPFAVPELPSDVAELAAPVAEPEPAEHPAPKPKKRRRAKK